MKSPSKKSIIFFNGIEIKTILDFRNWNLGFEYTKNVSIKNLNTKSVRITYQ
jgi:hypothetical protein